MEFKCFTQWNQLPPNSDALFAEAEKSSLFFSRAWFENLATTAFENDQSLLLVCVVEENEASKENVLAILPLISSDNKEWTALSHIYTSLYTVLMEKIHQQKQQQAILNCLAKGLSQLPFESLKLDALAADDETLNNLQHAMESSGLFCVRYAHFFNWFYPLQGQTFVDYMATRPSRVRNTIARKQRKLEREHGYEIRLYTGCDVQAAMADFHAVYKASWKANERFAEVMEGFITRFSNLGWTRLAILYIEGKPVATQLWFVVHKKASIFKLAYDEDWKQYSPGSILTQYLMETVIDTDKIEEIDFLTGNDHYKQDWMSERRQRWRMVITHKPQTTKSGYSFNGLIQGLLNRLS
ncbi:MAG: GNAT family N-acetyltransferase [Cocleimonas sp.]|nr:GNAT family N-acetyltransferase [Cocleimonas sp.]